MVGANGTKTKADLQAGEPVVALTNTLGPACSGVIIDNPSIRIPGFELGGAVLHLM
jgi:hypothetical protein